MSAAMRHDVLTTRRRRKRDPDGRRLAPRPGIPEGNRPRTERDLAAADQ
jgi:hypothetical protein